MMDNNTPLSYSMFLNDMDNFRRSGTRSGSDFNLYETPSHTYFKLLFYFWNGDSTFTYDNSGGLLAPTWQDINSETNYYMYNSAWSYLKLNGENERAEKLEQFITLLSSINSESPWYFNEVSGMEDVINRPQVNEWKVSDERKKISIKCLPDSFDQRIGTLLELYRDIVWSWEMKKEIVPANLRKFDMAIYLWESPVYSLTTDSVLNERSNQYSSTYRLFEFHNCEFDYNSIKSGISTLSNSTGNGAEYTIDIYFDDCYEHMYNSMMMRTIGDVIITDTDSSISSIGQGEEDAYWVDSQYINDQSEKLSKRLEEMETREGYWEKMRDEMDDRISYIQSVNGGKLKGYPKRKEEVNGLINRMITGAITEVGGAIKKDIVQSANRLFLGNLYTYSISKIGSQIGNALDGRVFSTINAIDEYSNTKIGDTIKKNSLGSLTAEAQKELNEVNSRNKKESIKDLGNIFQADTLRNNI